MKSNIKENNILWGVFMIILLGISYWICRFLFFEIHGMKQWANILAVFSLVVMIIASIVGKQMISLMTVVGYIGGFVIAMIFSTDGLDPGGGKTNNAWIIWGVVILVCLLGGLLIDVFYKRKVHKESSAIAIIGGADGPTSIYISNSKRNNNQEDKWNKLLEACKEKVVPKTNKIKGEELKKYLIDEYDAREIELTDRRKNALKYNVIMNYYPDTLPHLKVSENHGDDYKFNSDKHLDNINNMELIPDEKYQLHFCAFNIPRTSKTERIYQAFEQEMNVYRNENLSLFSRVFNKYSKEIYSDMEKMKIEMELSTGYMTISNGPSRLMYEIVLWKGVTQEDIDNCTRTFMSYAAAMRDTCEIIYCEKEGKWKGP